MLSQLVDDRLFRSQIDLRTHEETWHSGTVMVDFGEPLLSDVLEGGRGGHGEADEEDVGLWV